MSNFFSALIDAINVDNFLIRSSIVSFSVVYVLSPPVKGQGSREWLKLIGKMALVKMISVLLSVAATMLLNSLNSPLFLLVLAEYVRNTIIVVGYSLIGCRYSRGIKTVMAGTILATIDVCVNLSYSLGHLVDQMVSGLTIPLLVLIYGMVLGMALFQQKFSVVDVPDFPKFGKILIITANTVTILMVLTMQLLDTVILMSGVYSVIVYVVLIIFVFVCYLSVYFICTERNESYRLKIENQMMHAGAEQIALSKSNLEELRKIRHELKNKYTFMWVLLHEKRYEELNTALESFSPHNFTPSFYVDCGNRDISAIMTAEASKAHDAGIRIQHTLFVPPVLPFDSSELFSLISNLIDNAIEADQRYGITDDITVQMNLREEYLYICVTNRLPDTAAAEEVLSLRTKKEKPEDHGIGTQIVRKLAQKYNGHFLTDVQNDRFIAEVMLDMMYGKDGAKA